MSAREVLQAVRLPMEIVDGDDGRKVILYGEIGPQGIDAILSALDKAGYAVVPRMPTDGMVKAALTYIKDDAPCANPHGVYNAMLTAAKETP